MKKVSVLATTILAVLFTVSSNAAIAVRPAVLQVCVKAAPPAAVVNSFISIFGNVPVRQWKLRSDGNWRAHFMNNGVKWEATFRPDGTLVKSEPDSK